MRVFIAIELSEEVKKGIAQVQSEMMGSTNKVKWVEPSSMHVTLKFLGEVEDKRLNNIFDATDNVAAEFIPFQVEIKGTGAFPSIGRPKVLWVGIDQGSNELIRIVNKLEEKLFSCGFPREKKKWTPHITLGRVKQLKDKEFIRKVIDREKQTQGGKMQVKYITVMQSRLTPQGAIYTPLKRFPLERR